MMPPPESVDAIASRWNLTEALALRRREREARAAEQAFREEASRDEESHQAASDEPPSAHQEPSGQAEGSSHSAESEAASADAEAQTMPSNGRVDAGHPACQEEASGLGPAPVTSSGQENGLRSADPAAIAEYIRTHELDQISGDLFQGRCPFCGTGASFALHAPTGKWRCCACKRGGKFDDLPVAAGDAREATGSATGAFGAAEANAHSDSVPPPPPPPSGQTANGQSSSAPAQPNFDQLRAKWGVCRPRELKDRCEKEGPEQYVVKDLILALSLILLVGASGLGKSPFAYQLALCVAAGVPFLGAPVKQTRVLYLDFENGYRSVNDLSTNLTEHLGLSAPPDDLILWNANDSPTIGSMRKYFSDLLRDVRPGLVIVDPVSALFPEIEETNTDATQIYLVLRQAIHDFGCSIVCIHHLKKDSDKNLPASLEADLRGFFQRVRGASVLVNGSDIRLGFDRPGTSSPPVSDLALVMGGYTRVRGEIPTWYLARVLDANGEPLGYRKITGFDLLGNPGQEIAFEALPKRFAFKDAKREYCAGDQATSDFLKKCIAIGILTKVSRGVYEKV
jgi:hypothetical protein